MLKSKDKRLPFIHTKLLREKILDLKTLQDEIKDILGCSVSLQTVREDIETLQRNGKDIYISSKGRTVVALGRKFKGTTYDNNALKKQKQKTKIAELITRKFIHNGDKIVLGPGSTMTEVALALTLKNMDIHVLTPNIMAADILMSSEKIRLTIFGQEISKDIEALRSSNIDLAIREIKEFRPEKIILGAERIDGNSLLAGGIASDLFYKAILEWRKEWKNLPLVVGCHRDKLCKEKNMEDTMDEWPVIDFNNWQDHFVVVDNGDKLETLKGGIKKFGNVKVYPCK